ncbi:S46 family peptidase [Fodinibius saliphilus]|uniref:S46 family peptidase n=1 Tax=Fodinibius saliphilus TaxID=1920650 RepID=UPI001109E371|nr:S46 family peptidase [Fodinibius saliphilus]
MYQSGKLCRLIIPFFFLAGIVPSGCASSSSVQQQEAQAQSHTPFGDSTAPDDQGMWLLPNIEEAIFNELKSKGLQVQKSDLYHPREPSLNQSIVRINIDGNSSGTGSFVSPNGLILTSYQTAYPGITAASIMKEKYLTKGFNADSMNAEIPLQNFTLYITVEQKDVTSKIQSQLADTLTFYQQEQKAKTIKKELIAERKGDNSNLVVEIDDIWSGNRQLMSIYKIIRDVRLAHVPPTSIGLYNNDFENWHWPTHAGDFAFLRAYVDPSGQSQSYNSSNIPFQPSFHLTIDNSGAEPHSFTMTLGFPGQTYRNESSFAFEFYNNYRNPILIESYQAILKSLRHAAQQDSVKALKSASKRASIANALKYYREIQRGFSNQNILEKKRATEQYFEQWIRKDSLRYQQYRRVFRQLKQSYDIASQSGDLLYGLVQAINNNKLLKIAGFYNAYRNHRADNSNIDLTKEQKRNLITQHKKVLENIDIEAQKMMLSEMLYSLATLPDGKVMFYLVRLFDEKEGHNLKNEIKSYVDSLEQSSIIFDLHKAKRFTALPIDSARSNSIDPMVKLYKEMIETYQFSRKNYLQHLPYLRPAQRRYTEGMLSFQQDSTAYPDANATLRLSGGHIAGYTDTNNNYHPPFTTLSGLFDKIGTDDSFDISDKLAAYADSTDYQPVNFLSSNDITGGNSGSPVMNKEGEIIGLTLDSNRKGIIGDYYYDKRFKRAINVDIRYILFLLEEITGGDQLLKEMQKRTE